MMEIAYDSFEALPQLGGDLAMARLEPPYDEATRAYAQRKEEQVADLDDRTAAIGTRTSGTTAESSVVGLAGQGFEILVPEEAAHVDLGRHARV
jgi:hypothetical protein